MTNFSKQIISLGKEINNELLKLAKQQGYVKVASLGDQWKKQVEDAKTPSAVLSDTDQEKWMRIRMNQLNPQKDNLYKKNPKLYDWLVYEAKQFLKAPGKPKAEGVQQEAKAEKTPQRNLINGSKYPNSAAYLQKELLKIPELKRRDFLKTIGAGLKAWMGALQEPPTDNDIIAQIAQILSH